MKLKELAEKFSGHEMFNVYEKPVVDDPTIIAEPKNTKVAIFTKETYQNIDAAMLDREIESYFVQKTSTSFTIEVTLAEVTA